LQKKKGEKGTGKTDLLLHIPFKEKEKKEKLRGRLIPIFQAFTHGREEMKEL